MDINSLGSGPSAGYGSFRAASRLNTMRMGTSMLPSISRSSSGIGLGQDMYDAVSKQTQGLYTGGRAAMNSAYAVLGIDNSQSASRKTATEVAAEAAAKEAAALDKAVAAPEPKPTRNITDELLKESGFVPAEPNPYQVQTDFFA